MAECPTDLPSKKNRSDAAKGMIHRMGGGNTGANGEKRGVIAQLSKI
ncbi:MAG: hypothetical protein ACI8R4_000558 [Paracoccaceae bacterium]